MNDHDIAKILLKLALSNNQSIKIKNLFCEDYVNYVYFDKIYTFFYSSLKEMPPVDQVRLI